MFCCRSSTAACDHDRLSVPTVYLQCPTVFHSRRHASRCLDFRDGVCVWINSISALCVLRTKHYLLHAVNTLFCSYNRLARSQLVPPVPPLPQSLAIPALLPILIPITSSSSSSVRIVIGTTVVPSSIYGNSSSSSALLFGV